MVTRIVEVVSEPGEDVLPRCWGRDGFSISLNRLRPPIEPIQLPRMILQVSLTWTNSHCRLEHLESEFVQILVMEQLQEVAQFGLSSFCCGSFQQRPGCEINSDNGGHFLLCVFTNI